MAEKERLSFEKALLRLETIIEKLKDESLPMEESIELYEEGIMLSNQCTKTLEGAEQRIEKVHREQPEN